MGNTNNNETNKKFKSKRKAEIAGKVGVYAVLLIITACMIVP